jgi:hypothetical protein
MVTIESGPEKRIARRPTRHVGIAAVPLLIIPLLLYIALALSGIDFSAPILSVTLPSKGVWQIDWGAIVLTVALFFLFFEIIKSTRTGGSSVIDHAVSMIVFIACLILFLVWDRAATSVFFLLMLTSLIDVVAGFSVTIVAARRDYAVEERE